MPRLLSGNFGQIISSGVGHFYFMAKTRLQQLRFERIFKLFEKYGQQCYYCATPLTFDTATIDHFIPLSKGGAHAEYNWRPSCQRCNIGKGNKVFTETQIKEMRSSFIRDAMRRENQAGLSDFHLENKKLLEKIEKLKKVEITLSEAWHKERVEHNKTKKIKKFYRDSLTIILKKYHKKTIEELIG